MIYFKFFFLVPSVQVWVYSLVIAFLIRSPNFKHKENTLFQFHKITVKIDSCTQIVQNICKHFLITESHIFKINYKLIIIK